MSEDATNAIRAAIIDCFVSYAPVGDDPRKIESIAVDADWVAIALAGLPEDTRIEELPAEQRIAVKQVVQDVREVGGSMVLDGTLRRFDVSFANQGKNQKINPYPPGLFMLTLRGCAEVLRRKKEMAK